MTHNTTLRANTLRAGLLATACAFAIASGASAETRAQHQFNIPAESAADALQAFGMQTGKQVLFPYDAVAGKQSPAISGLLNDDDVLKTLVAASGLVVKYNDANRVTLATPEAAPQATSTAPSAVVPAEGIQEITVTATRTSTLASKTPVAVTAVTSEKLASAGITNPTQLMQAVPNLVIDRGNANGLQVNIRGVTSTGVANPSAAFLIDGIYVLEQNAQETAFYDLDRVEVLRGPQGTLYGRNTTAGVVNIISASPKSTYSASLDAVVGNYGAKQLTAMVNLPVNDKLAFRIAANYDARENYYKQTVPEDNKPALDRDNKSVRVSGLYKPNDKVRLLVKVDYTQMNGSGNGFGGSPLISNFYALPLVVPANGVRGADPVYINPSASKALSKIYADAQGYNGQDSTWGISAELNWALSDQLNLTWLGGYRQFSRNDQGSQFWGADISGPTPVYTVNPAGTTELSNSESQELRLAFDSGKLKAQGGLYFFHQHLSTDLNFGIINLPTDDSWQQSLGAFGQVTYSVTDEWRITGGIRETVDTIFNSGGLFLSLPFGDLVLSHAETKGSSGKVTWKVETDYDLGPKTMAYGMVATGYKGIGFNSNCTVDEPGCQYDPENLTDYEAGIKTRLMDNHLMLNASAFHYDYTNLQLSQILSKIVGGVPTPSSTTTNAGAAKIDGVEIEGGYIPLEHHRIDFSATWLNARYTNYVISPDDPASDNFNGAPLDHSPKWTLSAGYTYNHPLADGSELVANIHSSYVDDYAILNTNVNAQFWQPSYTTTDFSLRYNAPDRKWYAEAYVKNIENSIAVTYINTSPGMPGLNDGTASTTDPQTYGLRLGARF